LRRSGADKKASVVASLGAKEESPIPEKSVGRERDQRPNKEMNAPLGRRPPTIGGRVLYRSKQTWGRGEGRNNLWEEKAALFYGVEGRHVGKD